jgi:hypothetical protein
MIVKPEKRLSTHTSFHQHPITFSPPKAHVLATHFPQNPQQKRQFSPTEKKYTKYEPVK